MADEPETEPYSNGGVLSPSFTYVDAETGDVRIITGEQMEALQRAVARAAERLESLGVVLHTSNAEAD